MHRFVEPPTVFPFAPGVQERALGPVIVAMLRNMKSSSANWSHDASLMKTLSNHSDVQNLIPFLEDRAQEQPDGRKPTAGYVESLANSKIDRWRSTAERHQTNLRYEEYFNTQYDVVLGDPSHLHAGRDVVYRNSPTSLRDVEEETGFET